MSTMISEPVRDVFDARGRGLQHQGLRKANERAVLTVIGFNPGVSNADIARQSGLAPQTVSAILADLDSAGLIVRGEVLRGRRGQPATPIFLQPEGAFAVGVEVGWRHLEVLLVNLNGQVLGRRRRNHDYPDAPGIIEAIAAMMDEVLAPLSEAQRARLGNIGVALPTNMADNLDAVMAPQRQIQLWRKLDLADLLRRRTGLEVNLFNDGNAACWAELTAFPRPRPTDFMYFLLSHFIAAGIVGEGRLWEGPTGNSANLGSMLVSDAQGRLQPAHLVASVSALRARLAAAGLDPGPHDPADWDWPGFGSVLEQWLGDSARALAKVVFNTGTVIETRLVVIDSVLPAAIVASLVERLETELRLLPIKLYVPPQVVPGHRGALAPAVGAAELTLYRRYFSRRLAEQAG
jgi:predicted NBD/HSP70 family sugar kinase